MVKAIIFDADGVIFDNEDLWDKGQIEFLRRRGLAYNRSMTKHRLTGRSLSEGAKIMQEQYGFPGDPVVLGQERLEIMKQLYPTVELMPGFLNFYNRLKPKYKTAVATSSNPALFDILNKKFNLSELFENHIYFLKDVNNISKPEPDIFLYAAKMIQIEPKDCLVIEDAPLGVQAAKSAGMKCIGLTSSYGKDVLAAADVVVDKFEEINLEQF